MSALEHAVEKGKRLAGRSGLIGTCFLPAIIYLPYGLVLVGLRSRD